MDSAQLVELALKYLKCPQKELADRLQVSPTQITKWKNDEHMSADMERKIRDMIGVGDRNPRVVTLAGSIEAADKWEALVDFLAESAAENAETGYDTYPLTDEHQDIPGLLLSKTFDTLENMGIRIPVPFPAELDFDYRRETPKEPSEPEVDEDDLAIEASEETWDILHLDPYADLIYHMYEALNDVWAYYDAYVSYLINDDELNLIDTPAENIEPCLLDLAAAKLDQEPGKNLAPKFQTFKNRVHTDYKNWLRIVQDRAFRAGIPLREDVMELVFKSHRELGHDAERNSLGFNEGRLHPDVYMNELLVGMRTIHQVLPVILKQLGIYEEFKLDTSELSLNYGVGSRLSGPDEGEDE